MPGGGASPIRDASGYCASAARTAVGAKNIGASENANATRTASNREPTPHVMTMGMLRCATKLNPVPRSLICRATVGTALNVAVFAASKNIQELAAPEIAETSFDTGDAMRLTGTATRDGRAPVSRSAGPDWVLPPVWCRDRSREVWDNGQATCRAGFFPGCPAERLLKAGFFRPEAGRTPFSGRQWGHTVTNRPIKSLRVKGGLLYEP